jgi:hypothetical protein
MVVIGCILDGLGVFQFESDGEIRKTTLVFKKRGMLELE